MPGPSGTQLLQFTMKPAGVNRAFKIPMFDISNTKLHHFAQLKLCKTCSKFPGRVQTLCLFKKVLPHGTICLQDDYIIPCSQWNIESSEPKAKLTVRWFTNYKRSSLGEKCHTLIPSLFMSFSSWTILDWPILSALLLYQFL